ncbi:MAG: hypothetical protein ACOC9J_05045 [Persicimonas sp.]
MSTSPAQTTSSTEAPEPLRSLLAQIDAARALPESDPYQPAGGDPLDRLQRTMRGEAGAPERPDPGANAPATGGEATGGVAGSGAGRSSAGRSQDGQAVVGRAVLEMLRTRPLAGASRAEAVERLAAQLAEPDPDELRELLALLVTGQAG